jgi:hypothetical protein
MKDFMEYEKYAFYQLIPYSHLKEINKELVLQR